MLQGALPVLATPFAADGSVDHASLRRLVLYAMEASADGLVFPGVASEFGYLSTDERKISFEIVVSTTADRVPVIVGASAGTAEEAGTLAYDGAARGAAGAMVMAPASIGRDIAGLVDFFTRVADRSELPIILQNAPPPVGAGLPVDAVLEVASRVPAIRFVKEETLPCGQRISQLLAGKPSTILGVMGGAGGRYIVDELNRGACGTMPACELTEVHAAIVRAHHADDAATARQIFNRILPLLSFQAVFRMAMTKAVLQARGIFTTEIVRAPGPVLDASDRRELTTMLGEVRDLLTVQPPDAATVVKEAS